MMSIILLVYKKNHQNLKPIVISRLSQNKDVWYKEFITLEVEESIQLPTHCTKFNRKSLYTPV